MWKIRRILTCANLLVVLLLTHGVQTQDSKSVAQGEYSVSHYKGPHEPLSHSKYRHQARNGQVPAKFQSTAYFNPQVGDYYGNPRPSATQRSSIQQPPLLKPGQPDDQYQNYGYSKSSVPQAFTNNPASGIGAPPTTSSSGTVKRRATYDFAGNPGPGSKYGYPMGEKQGYGSAVRHRQLTVRAGYPARTSQQSGYGRPSAQAQAPKYGRYPNTEQQVPVYNYPETSHQGSNLRHYTGPQGQGLMDAQGSNSGFAESKPQVPNYRLPTTVHHGSRQGILPLVENQEAQYSQYLEAISQDQDYGYAARKDQGSTPGSYGGATVQGSEFGFAGTNSDTAYPEANIQGTNTGYPNTPDYGVSNGLLPTDNQRTNSEHNAGYQVPNYADPLSQNGAASNYEYPQINSRAYPQADPQLQESSYGNSPPPTVFEQDSRAFDPGVNAYSQQQSINQNQQNMGAVPFARDGISLGNQPPIPFMHSIHGEQQMHQQQMRQQQQQLPGQQQPQLQQHPRYINIQQPTPNVYQQTPVEQNTYPRNLVNQGQNPFSQGIQGNQQVLQQQMLQQQQQMPVQPQQPMQQESQYLGTQQPDPNVHQQRGVVQNAYSQASNSLTEGAKMTESQALASFMQQVKAGMFPGISPEFIAKLTGGGFASPLQGALPVQNAGTGRVATGTVLPSSGTTLQTNSPSAGAGQAPPSGSPLLLGSPTPQGYHPLKQQTHPANVQASPKVSGRDDAASQAIAQYRQQLQAGMYPGISPEFRARILAPAGASPIQQAGTAPIDSGSAQLNQGIGGLLGSLGIGVSNAQGSATGQGYQQMKAAKLSGNTQDNANSSDRRKLLAQALSLFRKQENKTRISLNPPPLSTLSNLVTLPPVQVQQQSENQTDLKRSIPMRLSPQVVQPEIQDTATTKAPSNVKTVGPQEKSVSVNEKKDDGEQNGAKQKGVKEGNEGSVQKLMDDGTEDPVKNLGQSLKVPNTGKELKTPSMSIPEEFESEVEPGWNAASAELAQLKMQEQQSVDEAEAHTSTKVIQDDPQDKRSEKSEVDTKYKQTALNALKMKESPQEVKSTGKGNQSVMLDADSDGSGDVDSNN